MRNILLFLVSSFIVACDSETKSDSSAAEPIGKIEAPGELVSVQDISITPPTVPRTWEFKIEFLAQENSLVSEGDLLVRFDAQNLRTRLIERQSELGAKKKEAEQKKLENEAKLEQLTLDLAEAKKNKEIAKRKVEITDVSRSEIERKKQQAELIIASELYEQAQRRVTKHKDVMLINEQVQLAKISKAQARVDQINQSIEKMSVKAPKPGMVTLLPNHEGDKPAIGDTMYMGARILSLPSLEMITVKVEFDEADTASVALGDEVRVTLDGYPERPFLGAISELGETYRKKSNMNPKVVFDAWVKLENMDLDIMRPGMKATVEVVQDHS